MSTSGGRASRTDRALAAEPVLRVEDLHVSFNVRRKGRRLVLRAVDGVTFDLRRGETLGIVGESGCGKTTLARALVGKCRAQAGRVIVDGQDVTNARGRRLRGIRKQIQIIFQDPYLSLDPTMTALESVLEPLIVHRRDLSSGERDDRGHQALEAVDISPRLRDRYPRQLSGGQKQRIAIARALVTNPDVIVADEPTSALDVSVQAQVVNLLRDIQDSRGVAYVFVSHNIGLVHHVSDRIAVMYAGRFVESGTAQQVSRNPQHPYTEALLSAVLSVRPQPASGRIVLSGALPDATSRQVGCRFRTRCAHAVATCWREEPALARLHEEVDHDVACILPRSTRGASNPIPNQDCPTAKGAPRETIRGI